MKTIKYMTSDVGKDPKNPLYDIHKDDTLWYFDTLVKMTGKMSELGQFKAGDDESEFAWEQLLRRRPKQLSIGKRGPNSVFSLITGLLHNYIQNQAKYGVCRISKKQTVDFEFACMFFHAIDSNFETVQWKPSLFNTDGVDF
jgi:hypothetical protein